MRTEIEPDDPRLFYRFLTAVVVPRPIAWVSTRRPGGGDNLAPHSFFTVACVDPPVVQFTSVGRKDTLTNIEATRQFVVNFACESLFEQVNATATDFPPDISEFDAVGLSREPSVRVSVPRVGESPVALECLLHATIGLGDSTVVFGRVVHASVRSDVLQDGHPVFDRLRPLSRLGRDEWGAPPATKEITRIRYRDWPGHYQAP